MPIYGYECSQCGHKFEVLQSVSEAPLTACPECMGPLRKLLYPVGVIFKGSGFYTTDYRGGGTDSNGSAGGDGKPAAEGKSDPGPKSDGGSSPKPDSKPSSD